MFYAQFVLSKKGPLAKIWLAAHWEKKLSKAQIYETDVEDAVNEIMRPKIKMALRTTGHLLLGIVRIHCRKTKYLLADCNEAFLRIKMAFRPGQLADDDDGATQAPLQAITLPEVYSDFDTALPEFNEIDFQHHLQLNQSRIEDITLKEDLISEPHSAFGADFGMDDFGESSLPEGVTLNLDEDFGLLGVPGGDDSRIQVPRDRSMSAVNLTRDLREPTPSLEGAKAPGANIFGDEDFGGAVLDDNFFDAASEFGDGSKALHFGAPGADFMDVDDLPRGATADNMDGVAGAVATDDDTHESSFALEPLDASAAMAQKPAPKQKRKRRLIVDDVKQISGEDMKNNMESYMDTAQQMDLAPPTRRLMTLRECGNVDRLFQKPGMAEMKSRVLGKIYQQNLVVKIRDDEASMVDDGELRRELNMADQIEDRDNRSVASFAQVDPVADDMEIPLYLGADFQDFQEQAGYDDRASIGLLEPPTAEGQEDAAYSVEAFVDIPPLEEDDFPSTERMGEKKADRTINQTVKGDGSDADEENRFTKRTQDVLKSISTKIRASENGEITLSDLLTKTTNRKTAAQKFYTLLVLKKSQSINVAQSEPYSDIQITAGPNIDYTTEVH